MVLPLSSAHAARRASFTAAQVTSANGVSPGSPLPMILKSSSCEVSMANQRGSFRCCLVDRFPTVLSHAIPTTTAWALVMLLTPKLRRRRRRPATGRIPRRRRRRQKRCMRGSTIFSTRRWRCVRRNLGAPSTSSSACARWTAFRTFRCCWLGYSAATKAEYVSTVPMRNFSDICPTQSPNPAFTARWLMMQNVR